MQDKTLPCTVRRSRSGTRRLFTLLTDFPTPFGAGTQAPDPYGAYRKYLFMQAGTPTKHGRTIRDLSDATADSRLDLSCFTVSDSRFRIPSGHAER